MPTAVDSRAPNTASCFAISGSKLAPVPSGIGKTVRKPWIVSNANSSGMPCGDSSTAIFWSRLICAGSVRLRIEPRPFAHLFPPASPVTLKSGQQRDLLELVLQ